MSILEIFVSSNVLIATLLVTSLSFAEPLVGAQLSKKMEKNLAFEWSWEHFFAPFWRVLLVVVFILVAYPTLFGLYEAPSVRDVLGQDTERVSDLIGILFAVTLVLPLLPLPISKPALVLPMQAIFGTGLVFSWLKEFIGVTAATPWPRFEFLVFVLVLAYANHRLVMILAHHFGEHFDRKYHTSDSRKLFERGLEPWAQIPLIIFYGTALGLQLAP